ncbi:DEAD/DEAH box helicase [Bacillus marinisedimentorum]|uniref:DEAD/DEAH box helicase n=1 Tax=Bacillus marinisedimentorum TaxID=1821260 RepID=UPI000872E497|nr:DEAD/DEAH box helicase [Bacillus marinisedimentorum]
MKETKFTRFNLQPFLIDAVETLGFYKPTEIQERIIPSILNGESAIGQSQTGTGKTHAYLLPVLNGIDTGRNEVQAVITAPTRELARQIYDELQKITKHQPEIHSKLIVGGTDRLRTIEKLKSQPHIIVGTPGRILDLMKENALRLNTAGVLVIDEADLMFDLGFIDEVDQIASRMPENLQFLVFSATIPEKLKPFLKKYMENPRFTHVAPKQAAAANIEHYAIPLRHRDRLELLVQLTETFNPFLVMIFANTKKSADEAADHLLSKGIEAGRMHGGLSPRERTKMLKDLKDARYQYVVATDLASRGIDIQGVSHVINLELPEDLDFYIHRVGRTARAGLSGTAYTLYTEKDEESLEKLEKRNISFHNVDLKNGELEDIGPRNKRKARKRQPDHIDETVRNKVKKPKKVKPGYKKKMKQQIETMKKRERRKRNK